MTLKPVNEKEATEQIFILFQDIKDTLAIDAVPLVFRFLAHSESYLFYLWQKMKLNIASQAFLDLAGKASSFGESSTQIIYTPSEHMKMFAQQIPNAHKQDLEETIVKLLRLNVILFLLTLDLREDLKAAFTQFEKPFALGSQTQEHFVDALGKEGQSGDRGEVQVSSMLVPLFGSQLPAFASYSDFFAKVEEDVVLLEQSEAYLKTRVELERIGLLLLESFPYRLNSSYKVFMEMVGQGEVAYELLYLLTNIFPTEFPRLLLTTCIMKRALSEEKDLTV